MSDYLAPQPIRTGTTGDVVVQVADGAVPGQKMTVNGDGSINATVTATDLDVRDLSFTSDSVDVSGSSVTVSATDLDVRDLSFASDSVDVSGSSVTVSATDLDIRDLAFATDKVDVSGSAIDAVVTASDLDIRDLVFATDKVDVSGSSVTVGATDLDIRDLSFASDSIDVSGSSVTVSATDLDVRDLTHVSDSIKIGDGNGFLVINSDGSINVKLSDNSGTERSSYLETVVASSATSNHDYTAPAAFRLTHVIGSGSAAAKIEVQIETASGSNTFSTLAVLFSSPSNLNMQMPFHSPPLVASGARVRVIRTNRDNQSQSLYSTILGYTE